MRNIYPEEIERQLLNIHGITKALVCQKKHKEYGYRPVALIQIEKNNVSRNRIVAELKKYLPSYKIPDTFYFWPNFSDFGNIKTQRFTFQDLPEKFKKRLKEIV